MPGYRNDVPMLSPVRAGNVALPGVRVPYSTFLLAFVAAAVAMLMFGGSSVNAQSEETYTFSGIVTMGGNPTDGMTVTAYCMGCPGGTHTDPEGNFARPWPEGGKRLWEGESDASGNWSATVTRPSEGNLLVFAWDPDQDHGYGFWEYQGSYDWNTGRYGWADQTSVDLRMAVGGFLSGRITADGGSPPSGVLYTIWGDRYDSPPLGLLVDSNGDYETPGLPDGDYHLTQQGLSRPYASERFWLGAISDGEDAVADHELTQYGVITGKVTDGSGNGLAGIIVRFGTPPAAVYSDGNAHQTQNDGSFGPFYSVFDGIWGLSLRFNDPSGVYAPTSRTVPSLASKEMVDLRIQMLLGGKISGRVMDWQGLPVPEAWLDLCLLRQVEGEDDWYDCWGSDVPGVSFDSRVGTYKVSGVGPGTYTLRFSHWRSGTEFDSEPIVVTEGSVHDVDVIVDKGGKLSGVVTDGSGDPIPGIGVVAVNEYGQRLSPTITGSDGSYLSSLLTAGEYTLWINGFTIEMDAVSVVDGAVTSGVNVSIDAGYVEGRVTSGGRALADATVSMWGSGGAEALTEADGSYRVAVAPGTYTASFSTPWHLRATYGDSRSNVEVAAGSTTSGIDADLEERQGPPPPVPPPSGTEVKGASSAPGGIPTFLGSDLIVVEHQGCANGTASLTVGNSWSNMPETPAGSGLYLGRVPVAALGAVGRVDVQVYVWGCEDGAEDGGVGFNIYIDPAGTVVDQYGNPIAGATVTLLRDNPDTVALDFEPVADGSVLMDPSVNNTNPDVTGADGRFRWDVVAGLWKVRAEASGCHAPGDEDTGFVETSSLAVPPPHVGLVLEMECAVVADGSYSDISGGHVPAIEALAAQGVLEGTECGRGLFCPGNGMKRWTMAVWLVRAVDGSDPDPITTSRFEDVDPNEWWAPYVERLAELEVTKGCNLQQTRYCPDKTVPREQMASFLVRAFEYETAAAAGFVDTAGSGHAADIDALAAARVTIGCSLDPLEFCPGDDVTREEMATFLARALGLVSVP